MSVSTREETIHIGPPGSPACYVAVYRLGHSLWHNDTLREELHALDGVRDVVRQHSGLSVILEPASAHRLEQAVNQVFKCFSGHNVKLYRN